MVLVRRALAFPFYLLAFVLHLLTALLTILAQKIAGEDPRALKRSDRWIIAVSCAVALSAIPAWVASRPGPVTDLTRLAPRPPIDFSKAVVNYSPETLAQVKPLIRLTACIYAERAIKQWLDPEGIGFEPCGDGGRNTTKLDNNLIDVTVSGTATVGTTKRPFVVTLQHNPISTDEDGFVTTDIQIDGAEAKGQLACAGPQ
jgi:hypothetical protein